MTVWNPWEFLGEHYPDWVIRFDDLHGIPELMCWERRVMLIDPGDGMHARRCSAGHAAGHLELMHKGSVMDRKEEAAANTWAAGMLIGVHDLADAAQWRGWQVGEDLASDLHVDLETLLNRIRIARTHPAERPYLAARQARIEDVA